MHCRTADFQQAHRKWPVGLLLGCLLAVIALPSVGNTAEPKAKLGGKNKPQAAAPDEFDSLLDEGDKGLKFRLVTAEDPARSLSEVLYWRTHVGTVAAHTTPIKFRCGGVDVIAPVLNESPDPDDKATYSYPTEAFAKVEPGRHTLTPGNIPLEVKAGTAASTHPAVQVAGNEVRILCAPIRLEIVDSRGLSRPGSIKLAGEKGSLLREDANFTVLVIWLPIGGDYQTSLGRFQVTAEGKLKTIKSQLAPGVEVTEQGLKKILPPETPATTATAHSATLSLQVRPTEPVDPKSTTPQAEIRFPIYVTALADAERKVWIAVSRKQYKLNVGVAFAADQFSYRLGDRRPEDNDVVKPLPLEAEKAVEAKLADVASAALGTRVDDLEWASVTLPKSVLGPIRLSLANERTYGTNAMVLAIDAGAMQLVPHRWRTAFTISDTAAPYTLLVGRGAAAAKAQVWLQSTATPQAKPLSLGSIELPAVTESDFDSRLFTVDMSRVPVGDYQLWLAVGEARSNSAPVKVVSWSHRSPFFAHSMSGCTGSWPTTDEGLQMLFDSGLEMVTATGFQSQLNTAMPAIDRPLAERILAQGKLPAELALVPTANDRFLNRLMQYPLRLVDLAVLRGPSMYLESLSYHHSYQPSVDRMIRNMQLYTQQTTEYPSFWGVNYSWFPALFGYAEGGVPTDAHVGDRNRVLAETVHAAGFKDITPEERKFIDENKYSPDMAKREQALELIRRAVAVHNAYNDLGWGKYNKVYNDAIRAIRPGTVCTLFENAGHNESKRIPAMFGDMNAMCYESYTDFGDWPMSSAFVTDWSKAASPGQPVWLTTCWGASSESKMRSLLHAFSRGLDGGGVPLQASYGMRELSRRGMGVKFLSQYGALTMTANPDRRVAVLWRQANVLHSRAMWQTHAIYYHLTRLGWPPMLLSDEYLPKSGIPDEVELIVLANQQTPIESETRELLAAFVKRGGKILAAGDCPEPIPGATHIDKPLKQLWDIGGFERHSHEAMWKEFSDTWGPALTEAMAKTGIVPYATTDPGLGFVTAMNAGTVRYVAVISDVKNSHADAFEPNPALEVSLAGTGWIVRDLGRQQDLPAEKQGERTATKVELVTEPTALLALYKSPPAAIAIELAPALRLGRPFVATAKVTAADKSDLGGLPIRVRLAGPDGAIREDVYRAAGEAVTFPLAALDRPGQWKYTVQELLTGLTTTVDVPVAGVELPNVVRQIPKIHVVEPQHLATFAARKGPKWIILEPEQAHLAPLAEKLVLGLAAAGADVKLWQVQPEQFDTVPVRWYPTPFDEERLNDIAAGKLIGVRQGLKPYIDKLKRVHVPSKGGYEENSPLYMVGEDCIVFSGGRLAESLRGVTAWMETPNVPGRGQGRLVTTFSPFMANRQAVAIVANDSTGFSEAVTVLASAFEKPTIVRSAPPAKSEQPKLQNVALTKAEVQPVARPYTNYTPVQRVAHMVANRHGQAAVLLRGKQDNVALVDAAGKVTATLRDAEATAAYLQIDEQGAIHFPVTVPLTRDQWGSATQMQVLLRSIGPDGRVARELVAYEGSPSVPDYLGGIRVAPDGQTLALGRAGGMLFQRPKETVPRRYDDVPNTSTRYSLINPRHPVGGTFSPDGRYLLFTMDSRPNFGGMGGPMSRPTASDTILLDLETGERVWGLRAASDFSVSTYAVHTGFAAIAREANLVALADFDGTIHLVDKQGKILLSESVTKNNQNTSRLGPTDGVSVVMSDAGETVVFGFTKLLVIARGTQLIRVPVAGLDSLAVSADGNLIAAALDGGDVLALDAAGKSLWTAQPGGVKSIVAIAGGDVLAANTLGELVALGADGKILRRTNLADAADRGVHPLEVADGAASRPWADYVEPGTLATAQKLLSAKKLAEWQPQGKSQPLYDRKFFSTSESIALASSADQPEVFVHLVYRRPAENKSLQLQTSGRDGKETFWLDLPTPEYRTIDIPVRGPEAKVSLVTDGPVEIAELSLWSIRWPGANLAFVRPVNPEDSDRKEAGTAEAGGLDDILGEVTGEVTNVGKMKKCRIWWPNTDVDQIRGPWIPPVADPYQMVNNKRFGNGALRPWSDKWGIYPASRGGFLTVDFEETLTPSLVATYDRASKQSELAVNMSLFSFDAEEPLVGGPALAGAVHNDQFWRLFPLTKPKLRALGIHVIKDAASGSGLSEVELYK